MVGRYANLRNAVWFVPVLCVAGGVLLALATLALDHVTDYDLVPRWLTGDPESALFIFSTVATSMVSLTALVLTITMVVVQLAMGQFSPRIVETFLRDRPSQFAIGIFVATFAQAMVAMREVNVEKNVVPGVTVLVAYGLVLVSVVVLVVYVDHIGRSLRVSSLIELVGSDTRRVLGERYPDRGAIVDDHSTITSPGSGVVSCIDEQRLIELAKEADCVLEIVPALGAFAPAGSPLVRIHGRPERLDVGAIHRAVAISLDRDVDHDVAYGLRMLVDIAERSLADSPFLDPTTAVQAIDRLHDCLRQLAPRSFPSGHVTDETGELRLIIQRMSWAAYVQLAFDEIRLAGAASPQVARRLREALEDLRSIAPMERRAASR